MVVLLTETEGSRKGIDLGKGISNPIEKLKKCWRMNKAGYI